MNKLLFTLLSLSFSLFTIETALGQCTITFSDIQISGFQSQCGSFDLRGGIQFGGGAFGSCGEYYFSGPSDGDFVTRIDHVGDRELNLKVFPNPFSNELYLDFLNPDSEIRITIVNILGVPVFEQSVIPHLREMRLELQHLGQGKYLLQVRDISNSKLLSQQFIIKF